MISVTLILIHLDQKSPLESPIYGASKVRLFDNLWQPRLSPLDDDLANLSAKSAFFIELNSGKVLFQKNATEELPIASLTKIMTVIVGLENKQFTDTFSVSEAAAEMEPDKMLLIANEKLTMEELLDGIFLVSANDAAEVIAEGTTGSRAEFIKLMNIKAKQLGMKNTLFINPSGLEEDNRSQYSSAFDVAVMARYAMINWPHLIDISSSPHIFIPTNETHQDYDLYSGINLLTTFPGVMGFKTGYTPEAGLTLVTLAKKDGKEVLGVLLGCTSRRDDAKALLELSFKKLGI